MDPNAQLTGATVLSTTNYDQFNLLEANRDINTSHVRAIQRSLEENGNWLDRAPIIVNERMEVVDGQHRLEAAKGLELPVCYTIRAGIGSREAQQMNLLHKNWGPADYLRVYVAERRRPYLLFQQLVEEFPTVSITQLVIYASGHESGGIHAKFRRGEFQLTVAAVEKARKRLSRLVQVQEKNRVFMSKPMSIAYLKATLSPEYRHRRMLEKLDQRGADLRVYRNVEDNLRQLEDLYNWHVTAAGRVRFF